MADSTAPERRNPCLATFEPVAAGRRDMTHTCDLDADHAPPHHCPRCDTSWRGHA